MNYTVEVGQGTMIYIPSFLKLCSDIKQLIWGELADKQHGHCTHLFFILSKITKGMGVCCDGFSKKGSVFT
jgi:hypothetical protein